MLGQMQQQPLLISSLIDFAERHHGDGEIVSRRVEGDIHRCTYRDIAQHIGRPTATRAVGAAIGKNPHSIVVPCHRVLGSQHQLTGYAGGLDRKAALLQLERST